MVKDKFLFFRNFKETADKLPDDLRLKFYDAMTAYVFEGVEPDDVVISALIAAIKPDLDKKEKRGGNHNPSGSNQHSIEDKITQTRTNEVKIGQNSSNEDKRGQSRSNDVKENLIEVKVGQSDLQKEEKKNPPLTPHKENNKNILYPLTPKGVCPLDEKTVDLEDYIAQKKPRTIFVPPTLEQVKSYIAERNLSVDAQKFMSYFEAGNWMDSEGKKVKNWKQKLITWDSRDRTLRAAKSLLPQSVGVKSGSYAEDIPL